DSPEVLRLHDLRGELFGGLLTATGRLDWRHGLRYEVHLRTLGCRLEEFGKHNLGPEGEEQLYGPVRATLHLLGAGDDRLGLKGNGQVEVGQGRMGQLPLLLDLIKAFGLRVPDRTAFDQAQLVFAIEGPQVRVSQFNLFGNAFSLRGQGTVD